MRARRRAAVASSLVLSLFVTGCVRTPSPPAPSPAPWETVVADRLFFGRNIPAGGTVSDSAWSVFLSDVVTPRLPAGFTVLRSEGQWRAPDGVIAREPGFVLEVEYRQDQIPDRVFEEIAAEYIRRFRQDAVLRVRGVAEQRLYEKPASR